MLTKFVQYTFFPSHGHKGSWKFILEEGVSSLLAYSLATYNAISRSSSWFCVPVLFLGSESNLKEPLCEAAALELLRGADRLLPNYITILLMGNSSPIVHSPPAGNENLVTKQSCEKEIFEVYVYSTACTCNQR